MTCRLAGQRFGRLQVLADSGQRHQGSILWLCACDCGVTHLATSHNLSHGLARSCGCLANEATARRSKPSLVGERFGRLSVLVDSGQRRDHRVLWTCRCDCGAITLATTRSLRSGSKVSCGCYRQEMLARGNPIHGMAYSEEFRLFHHAKARARRLGVPFSITLADVKIPLSCPALDLDLAPGRQRQQDNSPSLDRLRPEAGYVPGNVVVISLLANRVKSNATSAEVLAVADWMESVGL